MADSFGEMSDCFKYKRCKISVKRECTTASEAKGIKLGLFNGMKYIADGHGIDECNDEIAELFGVND